MPSAARVFRFGSQVAMEDVQTAIVLATLAAEAVHGRAQVRLDARFELNEEAREVLCDTGSPVGTSIASVFTVLAARMLGEEAFTVGSPDQDPEAMSLTPDEKLAKAMRETIEAIAVLEDAVAEARLCLITLDRRLASGPKTDD